MKPLSDKRLKSADAGLKARLKRWLICSPPQRKEDYFSTSWYFRRPCGPPHNLERNQRTTNNGIRPFESSLPWLSNGFELLKWTENITQGCVDEKTETHCRLFQRRENLPRRLYLHYANTTQRRMNTRTSVMPAQRRRI